MVGYKVNIQKLSAFLYTSNEPLEFEIKNTIPFIVVAKNELLRYKSNKIRTGSTRICGKL